MIVTHGLTKRYGKTLAVDDLSFDVTPGVVTGFLGPNGSGKSTTMRMIMGLDVPDAGIGARQRLPLRGAPLAAPRGGCPARRQGVPPGPERPQPPALAGPDQRHPRGARIDEVLDIVGLTSVADQPGREVLARHGAAARASPAPSSATPASCSSTSRSTASTPRGSAGSATCCGTWPPRGGRCSSPAT